MDGAGDLDRCLLCGGSGRRADDYLRTARVVSRVEQASLDTAERSLRTCLDITLRQHGIGRVDGLAAAHLAQRDARAFNIRDTINLECGLVRRVLWIAFAGRRVARY